MRLFSQSVADPSVFPVVLLDPSPRGFIQVASAFRRISSDHAGFVESVLKQVSVAVSNVQKCSFAVSD